MRARTKARTVDAMTVAQMMTRDVRTIEPEASVGELIRLLSQEQITGVPVVTDTGQLKGVVSVTDILRLAADEPVASFEDEPWQDAWDELERDGLTETPLAQSWFLDTGQRALMFRPGLADLPVAAFDEHSVGDIMTTATFAVPPETTIRELAHFLARGRIHRALVVEGGRLVGIVTAFDVVRAIAGIT
jgi:CBS domain-containing protein